ncbi:MAG TPA: peptide deformylase [Phycisphaerae bacterium]|nr:peptide deformylase [Phycisphaerae bacterium]
MRIRLYPGPVLRERSVRVEAFDEDLARLAVEMTRLMLENHGLGLAAPQVGVLRRLVVVSPDGGPGREAVLINPEIVHSEGSERADEGCLSFPGIYVKVNRHARVVVRYQDVAGEAHEMEAEGLLARAIEHEVDHLDGRLLVDRMSQVQRMANRRRLRELTLRYERRLAQAETRSAG